MTAHSLWRSKPSQWANTSYYITWLLIELLIIALLSYVRHTGSMGASPLSRYAQFAVFLLPLVFIIIRWLDTACRSYELTTERFIKISGVFNKVVEEVELYYVRDTLCMQPFSHRIMGLGNLILYTTDIHVTEREIFIHAIRHPMEINDLIRNQMEEAKKNRGMIMTY